MRQPIAHAARLCVQVSPGGVLILLTLGVASGLAGVPAAWFTKELVDVLSRSEQGTTAGALVLASAAALLGCLGYAAAYAAGVVGARLEARSRVETETALATAAAAQPSIEFLEDAAKHDVVHLARRGAQEMPQLLPSAALALISSGATIFGYGLTLWATWPMMALAMLAVAIPSALVQGAMARRAVVAARNSAPLHRWHVYYTDLFFRIDSGRDMRLFGTADHFLGRLRSTLHRALEMETREKVRASKIQVALVLLNGLVAASGAAFVAAAVMRGTVSTGSFVLFTAAVAAVQARFLALLNLQTRFQIAAGLYANFVTFVEQSHIPSTRECVARQTAPLERGIAFEDVWFRYSEESPWVLRGCTFSIRAGRTYGLVGLNGAGKSTIVKLLLRFHKPTRGQITWDGTPIDSFDPLSYRQMLSGVLQDAVLYEASVRENILLGNVHLTCAVDEAVRDATRAANAGDVVRAFPQGLETMIGTRRESDDHSPGIETSGGQCQALILARASMRPGASLTILDEPNAALDPFAERKLQDSLFGIHTSGAKLVISHRIGSLRRADEVLVLDNGAIREHGPHADLVAAGGLYASLFEMQGRGYQAEPAV